MVKNNIVKLWQGEKFILRAEKRRLSTHNNKCEYLSAAKSINTHAEERVLQAIQKAMNEKFNR